MAVAETLIDEITSRVDLLDLIGRVTPLKRAGRSWKGLCPFHQEKTPSFMVNPDKQLYYCFGCQAGGNAFTFLMHTEQMTFPEAVERLADRVGVTIEPTDTPDPRRAAREGIYATNAIAWRYFQEALQSDAGTQARAYLASRGVTPASVQQFGLGFAPEAWEGLVQYAAKQQQTAAQLMAAGLVLQRHAGRGVYDRFRQRLMFPIHDVQGRVIGFGGRALGDGQEPKYMNSPETAAFVKGRHLYGLYYAKQAISQGGAVIVEGYMDCLMLQQAGMQHVVAPLGTALTDGHARLLKRYHHEVILLYDADEAGAQATIRSLDVLLAEGLTVRVASVASTGASMDPDAFVVAQGAPALQERLERAQPFFEFRLASLRHQYPQDSVEDRVAICREMIALLRRMPDPLTRQAYATRLADALQLDAQEIHASLAQSQSRSGPFRAARPPQRAVEATTGTRQVEGMLIGLLLTQPALFAQAVVRVAEERLMLPAAQSLLRWMQAAHARGEAISPQQAMAHQPSPDIAAFVAHGVQLAETCAAKDQALDDCLARLQREQRDHELRALRSRIQDAERSGNEQELYQLLKMFRARSTQGATSHGNQVEVSQTH